MYAAYRALDHIVFVFEPGEEAREYASDVVDCDFACMALEFVVAQVLPQIVAADLYVWLCHGAAHVPDGAHVVG